MSESAMDIFETAQKKINRFFFKDYEGAIDLFDKAATRFKVECNYSGAGNAYKKMAYCAVKCNDSAAAGQAYVNAVNAFRKSDMKEATCLLSVAIEFLIDNNKLGNAARLEKDFADALCESSQSLNAIPHYENAARYFAADDQKLQEKKCIVAIARIYAENDVFDKALAIYERLGKMSVDSPHRFEAKDFFVRAMLCRLAMVKNDDRHERSAEAAEALAAYVSLDVNLRNTREEEFLQMCTEAVEGADTEKFDAAVSLLQELRMLDDWRSHLLLVMKQNMECIL